MTAKEGCGDVCCAVMVNLFGSQPCGKPAKVVRDGKPYCGVHDPVRQQIHNLKQLHTELGKQSAALYERLYGDRDEPMVRAMRRVCALLLPLLDGLQYRGEPLPDAAVLADLRETIDAEYHRIRGDWFDVEAQRDRVFLELDRLRRRPCDNVTVDPEDRAP